MEGERNQFKQRNECGICDAVTDGQHANHQRATSLDNNPHSLIHLISHITPVLCRGLFCDKECLVTNNSPHVNINQ